MMSKTLQILLVRARGFGSARKGNVAMMFGLALVPIMIAAGAGLDMARGMMARSAMSEALDAAALAVGSTPNVTQAQAQAIAQKYFNQNYKGDPTYGPPPVLNAPVINGQSVTLTASQQVNTTLLAVGGFPHLNIGTSTTVVWGQTKLWVSLVLDNTGSMSETDNTGTSKISALKTATHQLLTILANASENPGDVQTALVPFSKDINVGTGNVNASWIGWSDWESAPPNVSIDGSVGPGSNCPFTDSSNHRKSPYGYYCVSSATNGAGTASKVPSNGLICPGSDYGTYNSGRLNRYYNGCYNSVATQTAVSTAVTPTTNTSVAKCTSDKFGNCTGGVTTSNSSSTGSTTTTNTTEAGYSGNSTNTTSVTGTPSVGAPVITSHTSGSTTTYKKSITTTTVVTSTTVTRTAAGPWNHSWVVNSHSSWSGCVMDRDQNFDTTADTPSAGSGSLFPAENSQSCVPSVITPLPSTWDSSQWDTLSTKVDAMTPGGSTNQTIGLAHGMQALAEDVPYNAPPLPSNTTRYIILLSDGLNTQDRWYGDGSNQSTAVDARMAIACQNAKNAGYVIYTIFVDLGGTTGVSNTLKNCATDPTMYYDLTTSGAIVTAFNQIGQKITALRVAH